MLIERAISGMGVRSARVKLVVGAVMASLVISLGMLTIAGALGIELDAALPAAFGAFGAALFAVRMRVRGEAGERY